MHPRASFGKSTFTPHDHLRPGRPARNDEERAARHAEIERRYRQPLKDCSEQRRIAVLRRRDFETFCRASDVPDDGGLDWLEIAANHLAFIYSKPGAMVAAVLRWRERFTPMVAVGTATELAERVIADPCMPKADELAHRLGLTMEMRTALKITTIGAVDMNKAERAALRRERNNAAKRARRAKAGAAPHAASAARSEPWKAFGISRRTYYRKVKRTGGTHSGTAHTKCVVVGAKSCHDDAFAPSRPRAGAPARIGRQCASNRLSGIERVSINIPELQAMTWRRFASIVAGGAPLPPWRPTGYHRTNPH
jgi:hypothetical protein